MLIHENLLCGVKVHLQLHKYFGTWPVDLITRERKDVAVLSSINQIKWQWVKLFFASVFLAILWVQIFSSRNVENLITTLESMLYSCSLQTIIILKVTYLQRRHFAAELLNLILKYERCLKNAGENKQYFYLERSSKALVRFIQFCATVATPVLVVSYALQRWRNPCNSAMFLFKILAECSAEINTSTWRISSLTQLALQILFSIWLIFDMCGGFMFQTVELIYLESCCFNHYIKSIRMSLFQVDFKISYFLQFRQLQTLLRLYNLIQQDIMKVVICTTIFSFIVSLYALIYLGSGEEGISIPKLMFFSCLFLDCFLAIVACFGTFAGVHSESLRTVEFMKEKVLPRLMQSHNLCQRKQFIVLISKYVKSFRVFKFDIGEVNYVEKFTPVAMLQFCFDQVANLLLI
ncbi:unnamed protein product [Orchesella dallaii]|uniref:Gustatory receptor n=1 Tax=Orchesella dallaii TaxID=48710 RepID=A0ABP1RJE2_9HEXA